MSYAHIKSLDEEEYWIYLVWEVGAYADGSQYANLCAVDTSEDRAEKHKKMAEDRARGLGWPKIKSVHIEKRWTNHYFGDSMFQRGFEGKNFT